MPIDEYLTMCQNFIKYKKGIWYVLEAKGTKHLLSSLIIYELNLSVKQVVKGIGSIATPLYLRKKGYASLLVKETINNLIVSKEATNMCISNC